MSRTLKISPFLFLSFSVLLSSWASFVEEEIVEVEFKVKEKYFCPPTGCVSLNPVPEKEKDAPLKPPYPATQVETSADPFGSQGLLYFQNSLSPFLPLPTQIHQGSSSFGA